jgi:hypothetical protein
MKTAAKAGSRRGDRADTPAEWRSPDGLLRTGRVLAPAGEKAGSRVGVRINQAGDVVAPPLPYDRVELAQGLTAASFAVGTGMTGWLTRQRLERCKNTA